MKNGASDLLNSMKNKARILAALVFSSILVLGLSAAPGTVGKSTVIVGATIVDGSGSPGFVGSVRIVGDTIAKVGEFEPEPGERVISAAGKVLAPGFIDIHNHSQEGLAQDPLAQSQVAQGITTLVVGPDGSSAYPIGAFLSELERSPPAVNLLTFVGHATLRELVLGDDWQRPARPEEIARMVALVEEAMQAGAVGLSTGLEYDIGFQATTEEVIALARAAAKYGGSYMSHIRDEDSGVFDALREAIRIGEEGGLPVQISHIKLASVGVWGKALEVIALIEEAQKRGLDITADCYPYEAWASTITVIVPNRRYTDPESVAAGLAENGGAGNILIIHCRAHPEYEFRTLEEIAQAQGITPVELYIEIVNEGGASVVGRTMREEDVRAFYAQPWVMVASDGGIGLRHPRSAGTFPKVLGRYVREQGWLRLEEAIRKMTSLPAQRLRLTDRGVIAEGMKADLVIFDPERVIDRSTFQEPELFPEGVERVFVNGVEVWSAGQATGARPGRVIRYRAVVSEGK